MWTGMTRRHCTFIYHKPIYEHTRCHDAPSRFSPRPHLEPIFPTLPLNLALWYIPPYPPAQLLVTRLCPCLVPREIGEEGVAFVWREDTGEEDAVNHRWVGGEGGVIQLSSADEEYPVYVCW